MASEIVLNAARDCAGCVKADETQINILGMAHCIQAAIDQSLAAERAKAEKLVEALEKAYRLLECEQGWNVNEAAQNIARALAAYNHAEKAGER